MVPVNFRVRPALKQAAWLVAAVNKIGPSTMPKAGAGSPALDAGQQEQAASHASPQALVIHEIVREEGEAELKRRPAALAWSGLAAGLSMGFSFLVLALFRNGLPNAPWRPLVASLGYSVGFVIVILGR